MSKLKTLLELPTRKPRTRQDMIAFLRGHFRYDTMNSWNRATSYANCIKVNHLEMSHEDATVCYEIMEAEGVYDQSGFNDVLRTFDHSHDQQWQIGTNGRSGGYLVLYQGGRKPSGYHSRCTACGQLNCLRVMPAEAPADIREALAWAYHVAAGSNGIIAASRILDPTDWPAQVDYETMVKPVIERARAAGWTDQAIIAAFNYECGGVQNKNIPRSSPDNVCGRCHAAARVNFTTLHMETFSYPGRGLDMEDDFEDWSTDSLKDRVALVWEFDRTCEEACQQFLAFARDNKPEEETVMVPKKVTVAVAR